ncbi:protein of unknown function [Maribacter sedimenticola]|uniref:DUF4296 domain-containing protein n=1 Tax=Maribacter sedimenticola TaxID=228956 RepID=A0ABY1SIW9_9FLAO|nr:MULTISPECIES: DUF4296 domain-containing protein [Maribacter]TVZ15748.1 uncharacterized protein DUF4296 [Maribacter sp. MAR_2009_72]SNR55903.1 protein of unknown function [Maribacter sedimenticola]
MKKYLGIVLLMLVFVSCAESLIEKPDNLIPKEKMVLILKDMAIVNAAKGTNLGKLKDNGIEPTEFIFEKYEIDSAQFVDSDRYYASLPLVYESLYKQVETSLEQQREQVETAKKVKDSLNLLKNAPKKKEAVDK